MGRFSIFTLIWHLRDPRMGRRVGNVAILVLFALIGALLGLGRL